MFTHDFLSVSLQICKQCRLHVHRWFVTIFRSRTRGR